MSNTIKFSDLVSGTPAATDIYPFVPSGGASAKKVTFTALASAVLALNAGAVTADAPVLNLAQTWNNGAVAFTGLKFSVTDSASGAASLLLDLQVGASSKFKIDKAGAVTSGLIYSPGIAGGTAGFGSVGLCGNVNNTTWNFYVADGIGAAVRAGSYYGWAIGGSAEAAVDTKLFREAAGIIGQRNGTNAQTFNIYNTYTDASNYEKLSIGYASNVITFNSLGAGTGTARNLAFLGGSLGIRTTVIAPDGGLTPTLAVGNPSNASQLVGIGYDHTSQTGYIYAVHSGTDWKNLCLAPLAGNVGIGVMSGVVARLQIAGDAGAEFVRLAMSIDASYNHGIYGHFDGTTPGQSQMWFKVASASNTQTEVLRLAGNRMVQFGGITASFPALKPSSAVLQARLADDSAFAKLQGKLMTDAAYTSGTVTPTGYLTLYDSTGTAYRVPCVV